MSCALPKVAHSNTTLYAVGGYTVLRSPDDPHAQGVAVANSHLYTLSLAGSSTIDLSSTSGISTLFHPSPQRLPDNIPRIIWGNFFQRQGQLYLFGGVQTTFPIYLPNGTVSLANRTEIGTQMFTYVVSSATWLGGEQQSGLGAAIGQAAKAYDLGREMFWMYGGATWTEPYTVGTEQEGGNTPLQEYRLLWKVPRLSASDPDCVVNSTQSGDSSVSACEVNTTTVPSAKLRPTMQSTMVFVNINDGMNTSNGSPGSEGILILLGGYTESVLVGYYMSIVQ